MNNQTQEPGVAPCLCYNYVAIQKGQELSIEVLATREWELKKLYKPKHTIYIGLDGILRLWVTAQQPNCHIAV